MRTKNTDDNTLKKDDNCLKELPYGETVLVTGGAGFIGSHLVENLVKCGKKVIILDNLSSGNKANVPRNEQVTFVDGDIRNANLVDFLVKKSDMIFHLAEYILETRVYGSGHILRYSMERPLTDFDVTTWGTLIILEKARKYSKKIVFASSAAVYGEPKIVPIKEDSPCLPVSPYGASKLAPKFMPRYIQGYMACHQPSLGFSMFMCRGKGNMLCMIFCSN